MTPPTEARQGRRSVMVRARRRRAGTAAAAYSHALAITNSVEKSSKIAVSALRRGAGSRSSSLAHARHLTFTTELESSLLDAPASKDLKDLAQQLSSSRPTEERQIVDLELRYGLDHGTFSKTLGVSAARARAMSGDIAEHWAIGLDPAMMASLGPGSCEGLATLLSASPLGQSPTSDSGAALASTGTDALLSERPEAASVQAIRPAATVGQLLAVAPAIVEHAEACEICEQRLKLMTPVRSLVGQAPPVEVPEAVANAARHARRRIPAPLPPSLDAKRVDPRRLKSVALFLAAVAALLALGFTVANAVLSDEDTQAERVARLIEAAPASSILATPSVMTSDASTAALANNSTEALTWTATTSEPWLTVQPRSGRLAPNQTVSLAVDASATGDAVISIIAEDGSKQSIRFQN